ncbi:MAG: hypothetical protein KDD47_06800 [Acidobacteria bacterium]|nr:hypothetical protein [Acidobacteriota bacterium]
MSRLPVLGLVPAAGRASRLGPLPCSKELLPVGFRPSPVGPVLEVACRPLLASYSLAGIRQAIVVLREEKLDIPRYLARHLDLPVELAYVTIESSASVPETLDRAYPFCRHARVALGFPDVLFAPEDAYFRLIARQEETGADVVLGCFPWKGDPSSTDMVALEPDGRVARIETRPRKSELVHNWLLALWGPPFTELLHEAMRNPPAASGELQLGALFDRAREAGLDVRGVTFADGRQIDLGTPEGYARILAGKR